VYNTLEDEGEQPSEKEISAHLKQKHDEVLKARASGVELPSVVEVETDGQVTSFKIHFMTTLSLINISVIKSDWRIFSYKELKILNYFSYVT